MGSTVIIAELMSECGFPIPDRIYGQHFLKLDLLHHLQRENYTHLEWHFIGRNVDRRYLPSDCHAHEIGASIGDPDGYTSVLEGMCASGRPVVAVSSFGMYDSKQLVQVGLLRRRYPNLKLVVLLHCPRQELIRDFEAVECAAHEVESNTQQNRRTLGWHMLFEADRSWNIVDRYVAVSAVVRSSFLGKDPLTGGSTVSADKLTVITNGVDEGLYTRIASRDARARRSQIGVDGEFVVGVTSGWKRYKGSEILCALMEGFARDPGSAPHFLLAMLPGYSGCRLLDDLSSSAIRPLIDAGRVHLYLDIAKWSWLDGVAGIQQSYESALRQQVASADHPLRNIFEACWRGVVCFPGQQAMDVLLRPSLSEAFGRGVVEALLCGTPAIVADRGFLPLLVPSHCRVPLDPLLVPVSESAPVTPERTHAARAAARLFRDKIENLMSTPEALRKALPEETSYRLGPMLESYVSLVKELTTQGSPTC